MSENELEKNMRKKDERESLENSIKAEESHFLNNFYMRVLPENNNRWITMRDKEKKSGCWDKKQRDTIEHPEEHSDLWLNQKPKEFFETIDRVIEELDTDGEIKRTIDKLCNVSDYKERGEVQDALEEKLIPVFERLTAMGYTRNELTG